MKTEELCAATPKNENETKQAWSAPALTKLKVEDAESGNNLSEGTGTGS